MEVFQGRVVILVGDDPVLPILRHARYGQIASRLHCEVVEIALIIRVQDLPRDAFERAAATGRSLIGSSRSSVKSARGSSARTRIVPLARSCATTATVSPPRLSSQ